MIMLERERPIFTRPVIHRFLTEVASIQTPPTPIGLFLANSPDRKLAERSLELMREIHDSPLLHEEVATRHQISPRTVKQIVDSTMKSLWGYSPPEVQERYPLEKLLLSKRREAREKTPKPKKIDLIRELAQAGKSYADIATITGLNRRRLDRYRWLLKREGIIVPRHNDRSIQPEVISKLQVTQDHAEIKALLDQVTIGQFMQYKNGAEPLLVALKELADPLGLNYHHYPQVIPYLFREGIPVGMIEYRRGEKYKKQYLLLARHAKEALQILRIYKANHR